MMYQDEMLYSPLKLIYTAYSDERPIANLVMEEGFREMDKCLAPLPQSDQEALFKTFCKIYTENERIAFRAGVQTGFRLAEELKNVTFD